MKNKILRATSKLTALAMVASMFATVMPASAAALGLDSTADTLTRLAASTSAVHVLEVTTGASLDDDGDTTVDWDQNQTITFDYDTITGTFDLDATTPPVTFSGTGTVTAAVNEATELVTATCTAVGGCFGTFTITFSGTNPSAGTHEVIVGGTSQFGTGAEVDSFSIVIVDDDQVTINAHIDATMTFDIDTSDATYDPINHADVTGPYDVALGTLSASNISKSGATVDGTPDYIWLTLTHNATGGAQVTVESANAALQSISVPTDEITSDTGSYSAGSEHYGLCVAGLSQGSGTLANSGTFSACSGDTAYSAFTGSAQNLVDSASALYQGVAQLTIATAISTITPAHPDYADTLTFIATATY